VPIGHGTVKTDVALADVTAADVAAAAAASNTAVQKCLNGTFGHAVQTHGIFELPCRPCPDGMTTWDAKPGVNAADVTNVDADSCFTLPGYGYEKKEEYYKPENKYEDKYYKPKY